MDYIIKCIVIYACINAISTILNQIYKRYKNKQVEMINFSSEIISNYETWLNHTISIYMTKYIEEIKGKEFIKEDELNINSNFVIDGISYVCKEIFSNMPIFYLKYMTTFYGEDRLYTSIYEKMRLIFVKYVETERKKRLK